VLVLVQILVTVTQLLDSITLIIFRVT
jgi:hypothetical protein